ncbi:hypothetical protein VB715_20565 [Crocosphaera sp. UHCC 0190]|uniref:hypothetical protein n=1 Tax=Crocosphaera sp. UHCC 0190 TaxID=3110246 RepID=UPI002B21D206|nr:hypothetical protein [Crocosphaera sp. UHCC 0190]MEA5512171.1 hypothetical protein [Crocosphaera sp. UHCC 0190]
MKNLILGSLSVALLSSIVAPAMASEEVAAVNLNGSRNVASELSPVNLVQLAYQGYFSDLGIPSHGGFKSALTAKKIDAETLVRCAIAKGRLSSNALQNQYYLDILNIELEGQLFN